jgi:hypothetical protein
MKSKLITAFIAIIIAAVGKAQPPNNAIFFGSSGDGFSAVKNISASNAIFAGGRGDGFTRGTNGINSNDIFKGYRGDGLNSSKNSAASNTIFLGGVGDGWNKAANAAPYNNIFIGGNGDGWNKSGNAAPANNIFIGGNGDGWNKSGNSAPSNSIFFGGRGDGWSSVYRPQGPLPVTLLYFTARKQTSTSALVEWKTSQEINNASFDVERSNDAVRFTKIGNVAASGNSSLPISYNFTDNNPAKGMNYYRLKQIDVDGRFVYSPARLVLFDGLDASTVKYYPNPTNGILYVEMSTVNLNQSIVVNITNAAGIVINQYRVSSISGNKIQIDFSRYAKGIYFIQVRTPTLNSSQRIVLK